MTEPAAPTPDDLSLKTAIFVDKKAMGFLMSLSELTGIGPERIVTEALCYYRTIKKKEREGYFPAVVKDGKATRLVLEEKD